MQQPGAWDVTSTVDIDTITSQGSYSSTGHDNGLRSWLLRGGIAASHLDGHVVQASHSWASLFLRQMDPLLQRLCAAAIRLQRGTSIMILLRNLRKSTDAQKCTDALTQRAQSPQIVLALISWRRTWCLTDPGFSWRRPLRFWHFCGLLNPGFPH